jgi:hypothetical protein
VSWAQDFSDRRGSREQASTARLRSRRPPGTQGQRALVVGWLLALCAGVAHGGEEPFPPWASREEALEATLRLGTVTAKERIGHGITNPWKVTLEYRGERVDAVWKPLPEAKSEGWEESYRAEIAAYRLSRLLSLDMVPPTVLRRLYGSSGSMQLWVHGARLYADAAASSRTPLPGWSEQISRMRFFDALIDNPDRNAGNFLVDANWRVVLIDHSRALALATLPERRPSRKVPAVPVRFDQALLESSRSLDLPTLEALLGDLYSTAELQILLRQRDVIVQTADAARRRLGQGVLFTRSPGEIAAAATGSAELR